MILFMKKINYAGILLVAALTAVSANAEDISDVTNRFSLSGRVGFNISAKFKNSAGAPASRRTPDGLLYNYDDGYLLNDFSDNFGGQTWNWGYDDAAQIDSANDTVALSRSSGSSSSKRIDDDFSLGAELVYNRQIGAREHFRYGLEIAGNFLTLGLKDRSSQNRITYFFPYVAGTTPPDNPYQGTFNGPGFVIFTNAIGSITNSFSDRQKFDADLWGFRLGPYLEIPFSERIRLNLIGGLAVGFLDAEASWRQSATVSTGSSSGRGRDFAVLWGGYLGANLSWEFREDWSLTGGAQYQTLGKYRHSFAGRKVEVDLAHSIFVTLGIGHSF